MPRWLFLLCLTLGTLAVALAQQGGLTTKLALADLDPAAYAQWVDGKESPMPNRITAAMWTTGSRPEWNGSEYGAAKTAGTRHLRIGFTAPRVVTTVLVRGGGRLSVLKPDAAYPGDLQDETQWAPARRLRGGQSTEDEVGGEEYALWVLPAGTSTRALRFTHVAAVTDRNYAGWLGGAYLADARLANIAPQAIITTSARNEAAARIIDTTNNGTWGAWDNGETGAREVLSAENPETVLLQWSKPVTLSGLYGLLNGFGAAEVQAFVGGDTLNPREAGDEEWRTLDRYDKLESLYPLALGVQVMAFPDPVTTRAIRLRITGVCPESHPHLNGNTKGGKRIWLAELCALQPLAEGPLEQAVLPADAGLHPPIAVKFTLPAPGYVTLVIDDAAGKRVRNLVSETFFPAGENTAWWDGQDDLGRDPEAYRHGIYSVPGQFVAPGTYRVRGLYYKAIDLRYEFSLYNSGNPAWMTADSTGGWLTNHTPPSSALFVPAERAPGNKPLVYLGSYVSEGGHGLAWVDLDGRKQGGVNWVGGIWTGAPYLARDAAPTADANTYVYVGSAFEGELRLTALTKNGERSVLKQTFKVKDDATIAGLAALDNVLVAALPHIKTLLFVSAKDGKEITRLEVPDPRGVAFDANARLLVLSGTQLLRLRFPPVNGGVDITRPAIETVVNTGLQDPQHVTCDAAGNFYISDRGTSHQVKVFAANGALLRALGKPGAPKAGPYDPLHMNNPAGLTIDSQQRLWVAENDYQPKRVSVWSLDGKLLTAYYGPSEYGGGGTLDPKDKRFFYYHGMVFRLDWEKGTNQVVQVMYRPQPGEVAPPDGFGVNGTPDTPIYTNGKRYFTNCYNSNPTNGASLVFIWCERNGIAVPVAAVGTANAWPALKEDAFLPRWPAGLDPKGDYWRNQACFIWCDLNGDAKLQPDEVTMKKGTVGGITVHPDLSLVISRLDNATVQLPVKQFTAQGVPVYDLATGTVLARDVQGPASSGGDQALALPGGWTVMTVAPKPYSPYSVTGVLNGEPRWSYPNLWPGLHASHEAPTHEYPGEIIGVTRLLGGSIDPKGSTVGPLWCVNGNMGNMYLFTADGLFVATLFRDVRQGQSWSMPVAQRGMLLNNLTLHDENFWPSLTQTADGNVYLIDGGRTSLVRVDGLDTLTRLPDATLTLSKAELAQAQAYGIAREQQRQRRYGRDSLTVALRADAPTIDGKLDEWQPAQWVPIDKRGVAANFNSNSRPYDVRGAVAVAGDRLYAAFATGDAELLRNAGTVANAPFKTGGALDLMLGTNPQANANRDNPVAGDQRLLVTRVNGKTLALLYRAVVPGTQRPVPFSSPWRTITIDQVEDVSAQVQLAGADGNFELSIPLATLGLAPADGMTISGDLGILRGDGFQTLQRVYWSNKATGITADVPSEAQLTPQLWGRWVFGP